MHCDPQDKSEHDVQRADWTECSQGACKIDRKSRVVDQGIFMVPTGRCRHGCQGARVGANVSRHAPWATGVAPSVDMVPRILFVMSSVEAATGIFVVVLKRSHPRCPDGGPRRKMEGGLLGEGGNRSCELFSHAKKARATSFLVSRARSPECGEVVSRQRQARAGT